MGDGKAGLHGHHRVSRTVIARSVIAAIAAEAGVKARLIRQKQSLEVDLGLGEGPRRALAVRYNAILHPYGGAPVTADDAGDLDTVKDAVDLVMKRIREAEEAS